MGSGRDFGNKTGIKVSGKDFGNKAEIKGSVTNFGKSCDIGIRNRHWEQGGDKSILKFELAP